MVEKRCDVVRVFPQTEGTCWLSAIVAAFLYGDRCLSAALRRAPDPAI